MFSKRLSLTLVLTLLIHAAAQPAAPLQYGGKTYKTAKIGKQTWMAENLNYEAEGSLCHEDNPANCAKYGRLYKWRLAMKVCPEGWHLPSNAEWDELYRFVDGNKGTESPYQSKTAGKHLKAVSGWNEDGNGTDKYSFSALPGGLGFLDGSFGILGSVDIFGSVGDRSYWWSASKYESSSDHAYSRLMGYYNDYAYWVKSVKSDLLSVRCVKD
jgi:uncharacterized protein (TIGR02145 family)